MVKFDRSILIDRLNNLDSLSRMVFALTVSERLFPLYQLFDAKTGRGDVDYLRSTLNHLWELVAQAKTGKKEPFLGIYELNELTIPDDESEWSPLNPLAENSVAALAYACQCQLTGDTESAVWAAVQGYEAVDYIAHTLGRISFGNPEAEKAILSHEYVQAEIQLQLRDIAELEKITPDESYFCFVVAIFRDRAQSEGLTLQSIASAL